MPLLAEILDYLYQLLPLSKEFHHLRDYRWQNGQASADRSDLTNQILDSGLDLRFSPGFHNGERMIRPSVQKGSLPFPARLPHESEVLETGSSDFLQGSPALK